ncbi:hypothetical protein DFH29DRAFT_201119 [Suillus ampliporus]|nr:hypothetical protein DFH29DRAFT_201119 [Suillus ampliporus]
MPCRCCGCGSGRGVVMYCMLPTTYGELPLCIFCAFAASYLCIIIRPKPLGKTSHSSHFLPRKPNSTATLVRSAGLYYMTYYRPVFFFLKEKKRRKNLTFAALYSTCTRFFIFFTPVNAFPLLYNIHVIHFCMFAVLHCNLMIFL